MKLLLLTAALASVAFANPAVAPAAVGEESPIPDNLALRDETEIASDRSGNVAQTGTMTNSGAVARDLIQYVINVNEVRIGHLWRSAGDISEDESFSHDLEYRDQTTTNTNSLAVRNSFVQYIRHDSRFRNKIAKIVDNIQKGGVASDYQAGEDQRNSITNSGAVGGSNKRYSVYINGLHITDNDDNDVDDQFSMNYGTSPASHNRWNPVQTGTITNSGAINGNLEQYVLNLNDVTIDHVGRMEDYKEADIENS